MSIALTLGFWISGELNKEVEFISPMGAPVVFAKSVEPMQTCQNLGIVEEYICEVFGDEYDNAMSVLSCENKSLNPNAINEYNRNGSIDQGIFQINSVHGQTNMFNYKANIDFAYKLFKKKGWSPWACSHMVGVKPFYLI